MRAEFSSLFVDFLSRGTVLWLSAMAASGPPELLPIPHPSLEKSAPAVQAHVAEERRQFEMVQHATPAPGRAALAQAYSKLARVYHAYQFPEAALACYLNLDRIQPGIYPCQYAIGWIHHSQGRFDQAERHLAEAKRIAEGLTDTPIAVKVAMNCLMGDARLKLEKLGGAKSAFEEALKLDPNCAYAWHGLGLIHSIEGNSRGAIDCLERAVHFQPYASAGRVLLAREYQRAGLPEKAAEALPDLARHRTTPFAFHDPIISRDVAPLNRSAAAVHARALAAKQRGEVQLSAELFQQAIDLHPSYTVAKANLANACLALNRLEEAEMLARQVLDDQPLDASFQDLFGATLFKRGKFDDAFRAFQRAQELEPSHGRHSFWMGAVLSWQGRHQEARALFEHAAQLNAADAGAHIGAAIMSARLGKDAEARERLKRCVELFPASVEAKLNWVQFLSASPDATQADGEAALAMALPVHEQMKSVPAAVSLAMAFAQAGQFDKAIELQEWAVRHAGEQGHGIDLPWMRRNLERYQQASPSREPWNPARGYPALEGFVAPDR